MWVGRRARASAIRKKWASPPASGTCVRSSRGERGHLPGGISCAGCTDVQYWMGSLFAAWDLFCSWTWRCAPSDMRWFRWVSVPQKMCGLSPARCTDVGWVACLSMRGCPRSASQFLSVLCFFFLAVRKCLSA